MEPLLLNAVQQEPGGWRFPIPPAFGIVYLLCAGSLALPMIARGVLFNRTLGLAARPELLQMYYTAEWAMSFTAPLIGIATDRGGPQWRRRTVVLSLVANVLCMALFALGLVRTVGSLFAIGLPAAATHVFALAAINGALVADGITHGGGDTSVARGRQSAKLVCMTLGDLLAFAASFGLESAHAPPALVFALTGGVVAVAASVACCLPLPPPGLALPPSLPCRVAAAAPTCGSTSVCASSVSAEADAAADGGTGRNDHPAKVSAAAASARSRVAPAVCVALAATLFMLPPTSFDAVGSFLYSRPGERPLPTSILSAMQMTGMAGTLIGTCLMWKIDLPLKWSLLVGALGFAFGSISQLWLFSLGSSSVGLSTASPLLLLLQPVVQSALTRCGLIPIYNLAAAAAETRGGEGTGFALVMAAEAGGGVAASSIAALTTRALRLGQPPGRSWARLPLFVCICAASKLVAVPFALLLVVARERAIAHGRRRDTGPREPGYSDVAASE